MESATVNLKIMVFSQTELVKIVNIQDFSGLDVEIFAFGFDSNGEPVQTREQLQNAKYRVTGSSHGGVSLNNVFNRGLLLNATQHKPSGKYYDGRPVLTIVEPKRVFAWEAVTLMLSRNGCAANPEEIREKTENVIRSGVNRIHFYRLANTYGMKEDYGLFRDVWLVSGEIPSVSYDMFNTLLKKIGSPWRILTANSLKLLRKLEYEKLTQETANL